MSKEDIIKNIEMIDDELKKNEEFINTYNSADVMILHTTSKLLKDARKMWVDMLLYEYGIFYV
jgi:hypothetical protein